MKRKRIPNTDQEWLKAIRDCRSGNLCDKDWCEANGISRSRLYYHIRKLRDKGYDIPRPSRSGITCVKQEVIPLTFKEESFFPEDFYSDPPKNPGIAASVFIGNVSVDIRDGASGATIRDILSALGGLPC